MIKIVPKYQDSFGVEHETLDAAADAERLFTIQSLLEKGRLGVDITTAEAPRIAKIIDNLRFPLARIFSSDFKSDLEMPFRPLHTGGEGAARWLNDERNKTRAEGDGNRPYQTMDCEKETLSVGDTVRMVSGLKIDRQRWGPQDTKRIESIDHNGGCRFLGDGLIVWPPDALKRVTHEKTEDEAPAVDEDALGASLADSLDPADLGRPD